MLGLKMTVRNARGKTLYHSVISNEVALLSFDEHGERYMRFCYAVLDVPKDLPADAPLSFSFSCFGNYEAFRKSNPDARIVLRKVIEKYYAVKRTVPKTLSEVTISAANQDATNNVWEGAILYSVSNETIVILKTYGPGGPCAEVKQEFSLQFDLKGSDRPK